MINATLHWDYGRDGFNCIVYCERFGDTIREADMGFTEAGSTFTFFGFLFGWRKVVIYSSDLRSWHSPHDDMPFTDEDRKRVVNRTLNWLQAQGCLAKAEER